MLWPDIGWYVEVIAYYSWWASGCVVLFLGYAFLPKRISPRSRTVGIIILSALTILYVSNTLPLVVTAAYLSDENDRVAEAAFYRLATRLSGQTIIRGIRSDQISDNAKFYLCLALKSKLPPDYLGRDQILHQLEDLRLVRPGFFSTNGINVPYMQRAIVGPAFRPLELVIDTITAPPAHSETRRQPLQL